MKTESIKLKVEGIEKVYTLKPFKWDTFPKLFAIMGKFQGVSEKDMTSHLDEKTMKDLMELELQMFKESYPEMKEEELKDIILPNIFEILPVMVELNFEKQ